MRSAAIVLAPAGHPVLPALDEAGIGCQLAGEPPLDPDGVAVWLPDPLRIGPARLAAGLAQALADIPAAGVVPLSRAAPAGASAGCSG